MLLKTPIRLSDDLWLDGEPVDAEDELLCLWQADHAAAAEMVTRVNEYESLVSKCDKLTAQRDTLATAVNLTATYLGLWTPDAKTMQARHYEELSEVVAAASALVHRKPNDAAP